MRRENDSALWPAALADLSDGLALWDAFDGVHCVAFVRLREGNLRVVAWDGANVGW